MDIVIITSHKSNRFHRIRNSYPESDLVREVTTVKEAKKLGLSPCPLCFSTKECDEFQKV